MPQHLPCFHGSTVFTGDGRRSDNIKCNGDCMEVLAVYYTLFFDAAMLFWFL